MTRLNTHAQKTTENSRIDDVIRTGSQADYEAFLPTAMALAPSVLIPMRADPQLALHNVQIGVRNVLAEGDRLGKLPTEAKAISTLPRVALAVVFASTQVFPVLQTPGLAALLERGAVLQSLLLKTADALAESGLFPKAAVAIIKKGRGKLDAAEDLVALAALFAKHASAVRGKHAVSAAQIKEAADTGTQLLKILKPGRARRQENGQPLAAEQRDRLWTLLVQGQDQLWRAGAFLFGRDLVETKVPPLQATRGGRGKKGGGPPPVVNGVGTKTP